LPDVGASVRIVREHGATRERIVLGAAPVSFRKNRAGSPDPQHRHGERTKAAIAEERKFNALLKMLRAGLT
jgi:hypothetical protein